jgi:hypothetical protein
MFPATNPDLSCMEKKCLWNSRDIGDFDGKTLRHHTSSGLGGIELKEAVFQQGVEGSNGNYAVVKHTLLIRVTFDETLEDCDGSLLRYYTYPSLALFTPKAVISLQKVSNTVAESYATIIHAAWKGDVLSN